MRFPAPILLLAASLGLPAPALSQPLQGCRYLIIAADDFTAILEPLAQWKTRKGMLAKVFPLSQTGSSPTAVRDFVRNAWTNWPVRPEYVLIVASPEHLPGYQGYFDTYYGDMAGDYLMELPVGRLPAENIAECRTMVNRCLAYERAVFAADTSWLLKGTTAVGEADTVSPDPYYLPDCRHVHQLWRENGFTLVESLYNLRGHGVQDLVAALNDGRSFIGFRGIAGGFWWGFWEFCPDSTWRNGSRMPVIVSATCATVSLAPEEHMLGDLSVRFGTPDSLGGALAFFGTTLLGMSISAERSACFRGFFDAIHREGTSDLGLATLRGRFRVDSLFHDPWRYEEWTLLGDPALQLWTRPPRPATVSHDTIVATGPQTFTVTVLSQGSPVSGAIVCASMDTMLCAVDTTDQLGQASLEICPTRPGPMDVVVSGRNLLPYEGRCAVVTTGQPSVYYLRHTIVDPPPGGNGDGFVGAGETITMPVWVRNYGDSAAHGLAGSLATSDSLATVLDSFHLFGTVPGFDSAWTGPSGYRFAVSSECREGQIIRFILTCRDSALSVWSSEIPIEVTATQLEIRSVLVQDSAGNNNGRLDPRETGQLLVTIENVGSAPANNVRAVLRSSDARLTVLDTLGTFGDIPPWTRRTNAEDPFTVGAGIMMPETQIRCSLDVYGIGCRAVLPFTITIGQLGPTDPTPDGPSTHPRYWAYEDCDTLYPEHPAFEWVELRGLGTRLQLRDNETVTIDLPPSFGPLVYYYREYNQLSICSNGWLAPGSTTYNGWSNVQLPRGTSPGLICPSWDDFYPALGCAIWYYHDSLNHRFIVEWDSIHYRVPHDRFETFQVQLCDTTCQTRTGNSVFLFQYRTASWLRSSTVGIQDPTGQIGITMLLDTTRHRTMAPIVPGRAIKLTTEVPIPAVAEAAGSPSPMASELIAWPNPFRHNLTIRWSQPIAGPVQLGLCDVTGRQVRAILNGHFPAGPHHVSWNGTDASGHRLPAGVYFLKLTAPAQLLSRKLLIPG